MFEIRECLVLQARSRDVTAFLKATGLTALDARENDFALMGAQIEALKTGKAVYKPIYNHDTGNKDPPELIEPNKVMVFEGLHPIYDEKARSQLDLAIYIDIVNDVKFAWKVQRDVAERGWTEEQARVQILARFFCSSALCTNRSGRTSRSVFLTSPSTWTPRRPMRTWCCAMSLPTRAFPSSRLSAHQLVRRFRKDKRGFTSLSAI